MQQSPDVGISIAHPGTRGQRFEAMFPKTSQFLNKESPASPSILHDFPGIIVNFFHLCYEDFFLTVSGRHDKMDPLSTKCKCVDGEKTIFFCVQRAAGWCKAGAEGLGYWPLSGRAEQTVGSDGCPPLPGQRFAAKGRSCKVAVSTKGAAKRVVPRVPCDKTYRLSSLKVFALKDGSLFVYLPVLAAEKV